MASDVGWRLRLWVVVAGGGLLLVGGALLLQQTLAGRTARLPSSSPERLATAGIVSREPRAPSMRHPVAPAVRAEALAAGRAPSESPWTDDAQRSIDDKFRELESKLDEQARDSIWMQRVSDRVSASARADGGIGAKLVDTRCGQTLCRLEFVMDDIDHSERVTETLTQLPDVEGGSLRKIESQRPGESSRVVAFIRRNAEAAASGTPP